MSHVLSAVAWPYANGPRHIGHVAGFGVPSDVFSRYMRMAGHDVLMVSGTDEHGTPILVAADQDGVTPEELADKNNAVIVAGPGRPRPVLRPVHPDHDRATTTSSCRSCSAPCTATATWSSRPRRPRSRPSTGRTLPDRYIEGTCPICGYADARGDQCDNCGNQLDATDLIDPRSKINGETPEFVETQHFFLDLPALAEALEEWLDEREATGLWRPNVIKFSQNILKDIRPRAMTRDIDWGIPVPLDGWRDQPTKRLYVWFDAVIGYLSAGSSGPGAPATRSAGGDWWNDPEALSYYFMGKDNIIFHSQIWPAELLAYDGHGDRGGEPGEYGVLNLPTEVVSSEYLTMESKQFSSSRGHVIYVHDLLARYQPDALRYFICAAGPETSDADFTWAEFVQRTNSELVAGWGNLVNRTATMIAKSFGEIPPCGDARAGRRGGAGRRARAGFDTVGDLIGRHRQRAAIAEAMRVVGEVNKYLTVTEPYKMKDESQRDRLATVLHVAAQCVADCNTLLAPFLPHSANAVWRVLGGQGEFMPMPRIEHVEDLDPGPAPASTSTRSSPATTPPRRRGSRDRSPSGAASTSRRRSSPSSTRRWSTRSSPGCES